MFKKEFNENELAAIELLALNEEFAVVTRDKNGQYYVIDLEEEDEDDIPRVRMFKPHYTFDGKQERIPKTLVALVEFELKHVKINDNERAVALVVQDEKVLPDAFARDSIYKFIEGFANYTNAEYEQAGEKGPIDAIIIKGVSLDGKKNGFVPYKNLGFDTCFAFGSSCAIKRSKDFTKRKFNNNFEELYNFFEGMIQNPSEKV